MHLTTTDKNRSIDAEAGFSHIVWHAPGSCASKVELGGVGGRTSEVKQKHILNGKTPTLTKASGF